MSQQDAPSYLKEMSRIVHSAPDQDAECTRRDRMSTTINQRARQLKEAETLCSRRSLQLGGVALAAAAIVLAWWASPLSELVSPSTSADGVASMPPANAPVSAMNADSSATDNNARADGPTASTLPHGRSASLVSGSLSSQGASIVTGSPLGEDEVLVVGRKPVLLVLANGTSLEASVGSSLSVHAKTLGAIENEVVGLNSGSVELKVPKLSPWQRLKVRTAEALVEVRGTAFVVTRSRTTDAGGHPFMRTHVSLSEGSVEIRSLASGEKIILSPGQNWQSPIVSKTKNISSNGSQIIETKPAANSRQASLLAAQNRLYQSAMHAKRNHMPKLAVVRLNQLLRKYPNSPLASGARRELKRLAPK